MNTIVLNQENITFIVALTAGFMTFFSPCILPLLPSMFFTITGLTFDEFKSKSKKELLYHVLKNSILFSIGFSSVFILLGASATAIGNFLFNNKELFMKIGGVLIILFGIFFLDIFKIPFLNFEKKIHIQNKKRNSFFSLIFGFTFAFGWTPCVGPVLISILAYSSTLDTVYKGIGLLGTFSIALSAMFIISSIIFVYSISFIKNFNKYTGIIKKISGLIMILFGILLIIGII